MVFANVILDVDYVVVIISSCDCFFLNSYYYPVPSPKYTGRSFVFNLPFTDSFLYASKHHHWVLLIPEKHSIPLTLSQLAPVILSFIYFWRAWLHWVPLLLFYFFPYSFNVIRISRIALFVYHYTETVLKCLPISNQLTNPMSSLPFSPYLYSLLYLALDVSCLSFTNFSSFFSHFCLYSLYRFYLFIQQFNVVIFRGVISSTPLVSIFSLSLAFSIIQPILAIVLMLSVFKYASP